MPAAEETTDDSAAPDPGSRPEPRQERAEAGAARSRGQTARRVALTAVVTLAALVALRAAGVGQDGSLSDDEGDRERAGSATSAAPSSTAGSPSTEAAPSTPSSSVAPPDLEPERSPVDVAAGPAATDDPVEVARWWAAVLVAYEGAEPAPDLVARLAPFTSDRLESELLALPPAASYDAPADVTGVSAQVGSATAGGGQQVTVSVETSGALVVYELVLVRDQAGAWVVDQATRV